MSLALIVSPGAETDILGAFFWYEERQAELGRRFIGELDSAFRRIQDDSLSYREILPGIRQTLLHVFPNLVFYTLREDALEILAVIHASQDPADIQQRLNA